MLPRNLMAIGYYQIQLFDFISPSSTKSQDENMGILNEFIGFFQFGIDSFQSGFQRILIEGSMVVPTEIQFFPVKDFRFRVLHMGMDPCQRILNRDRMKQSPERIL